MTETHIRILQVALLAPPAAALGFARGVEMTITHGMVSGALTCAFIVSAIIVWGFLMGDLLDSVRERQAARAAAPRYQKRVTPDSL
ncbi:MAG: hypothetical protein LUQ42_04690 [Methanomicrobiales archaeon]|jgi:hypothetical protein|nr:hypothetical protein [Methanomicrobiales archaeon]MDD1639193.1 hypothetical protein [Methanomicrobiales archaeon]MDD1648563.1 hypothetical protein [Methanomicrobiales archaeon]